MLERRRRRLDGPAARPEVVEAWRRLVVSRGSLPIAALAADLGWSRRHLGEGFRDELGLAPKAAARVLRLEAAVDGLRRGSARTLAELAVECGFYDQAHLAREFVDLAGCPPSQWVAEELPSVQGVGVTEGGCCPP